MAFTAFFSCSSKSKDAPSVEYVIKVDSIVAADTIHLPEELVVGFYGVVGSDGCHHFERFYVDQDSTSADFMLIGSKETDENIMCNQAVQMLNGISYTLAVKDTGDFYVRVTNPGLNQSISKKIKVVNP